MKKTGNITTNKRKMTILFGMGLSLFLLSSKPLYATEIKASKESTIKFNNTLLCEESIVKDELMNEIELFIINMNDFSDKSRQIYISKENQIIINYNDWLYKITRIDKTENKKDKTLDDVLKEVIVVKDEDKINHTIIKKTDADKTTNIKTISEEKTIKDVNTDEIILINGERNILLEIRDYLIEINKIYYLGNGQELAPEGTLPALKLLDELIETI